MPQDVGVSLDRAHFEVPVIRRQPAIDDVGDLDLPFPEMEPDRPFIAAIPGITLHRDGKNVVHKLPPPGPV